MGGGESVARLLRVIQKLTRIQSIAMPQIKTSFHGGTVDSFGVVYIRWRSCSAAGVQLSMNTKQSIC